MTINYADNYGSYRAVIETIGRENAETEPMGLGKAVEFLKDTMKADLRVSGGFIYDNRDGDIVMEFYRDNDDFLDEDEEEDNWYDPYYDDWREEASYDGDLEMGFNPYLGAYDYDC